MCSRTGKKGFTLIEAMIATACLVAGVVSVSSMFAYSARTNFYTEQLTTAILLANAKSEELAAQGLPNLPVGGGLDPASPVTSYCEYISVGSDGSVTVSNDQSMPFLRMWQISGNNPRLISVAVVAQASGISGDPVELIRTTTQVAN